MTDSTHQSMQDAIRTIGFVVRPVVGMSMLPLLNQETDTVRLIAVNRPLVKYDIPLYVRPSGEYVLHRIIKVCDGYYIIRGDNTDYTEIVPFDWVIAVADGCSKNGVWHSFSDKDMIRYAKRVVRWWRLRNYVRTIRRKISRIIRGVR